MIENLLLTKNMSLLEKGLDTASLRNQVLANNLANVDTPGFKRSDVAFEEELKKAIAGKGRLTGFITNEKHIPIGGSSKIGLNPKVVIDKTTTMRNDGNNVDIDREMAALSKNSIMYNALVQEISGEFTKIKSAIEGR